MKFQNRQKYGSKSKNLLEIAVEMFLGEIPCGKISTEYTQINSRFKETLVTDVSS